MCATVRKYRMCQFLRRIAWVLCLYFIIIIHLSVRYISSQWYRNNNQSRHKLTNLHSKIWTLSNAESNYYFPIEDVVDEKQIYFNNFHSYWSIFARNNSNLFRRPEWENRHAYSPKSDGNSTKTHTINDVRKCHFDVLPIRVNLFTSHFDTHTCKTHRLCPIARHRLTFTVCTSERNRNAANILNSNEFFISQKHTELYISFCSLSCSIFLINRIRSAIWFIIISL